MGSALWQAAAAMAEERASSSHWGRAHVPGDLDQYFEVQVSEMSNLNDNEITLGTGGSFQAAHGLSLKLTSAVGQQDAWRVAGG